MNALTRAPSFYAPVPERERADDLFKAYAAFLDERNGGVDRVKGFVKREASMADMATWSGSYSGLVDAERVNRNYAKFDGEGLSDDELALLAFVKVNAAEAYGVEVTSKARAHLMAREEPIFQVERVLNHEETYHTKILVGAVQHFDGLVVEDAWSPPWSLRVLIGALAVFPPTLFHPVLLGSEISGVYTFNWMLNRLSTLFPNDPEIRESMERRLIEVLIDEVGHIAYNRIAVGGAGLRASKTLAGLVSQGNRQTTPELNALGFSDAVAGAVAGFDYSQLPQEVRDRSWFV